MRTRVVFVGELPREHSKLFLVIRGLMAEIRNEYDLKYIFQSHRTASSTDMHFDLPTSNMSRGYLTVWRRGILYDIRKRMKEELNQNHEKHKESNI